MSGYLALIGDLKKSRSIAERSDAQQDIKQALEAVSAAYPKLFASRLTLTLGDEFQALLFPGQEGFMRMMDDLELRLIRYPFRVGLGAGSIVTAIDPDISIGADGEAYWRAREAINYVHANDAGGKVRTHLIGMGEAWDPVLNGLLEATDLIKYGWTNIQRDTFLQMIRQGIYSETFDQKSFAQSIGISESSLTKRLNAGNIKFYIKLRRAIEHVIIKRGQNAAE